MLRTPLATHALSSASLRTPALRCRCTTAANALVPPSLPGTRRCRRSWHAAPFALRIVGVRHTATAPAPISLSNCTLCRPSIHPLPSLPRRATSADIPPCAGGYTCHIWQAFGPLPLLFPRARDCTCLLCATPHVHYTAPSSPFYAHGLRADAFSTSVLVNCTHRVSPALPSRPSYRSHRLLRAALLHFVRLFLHTACTWWRRVPWRTRTQFPQRAPPSSTPSHSICLLDTHISSAAGMAPREMVARAGALCFGKQTEARLPASPTTGSCTHTSSEAAAEERQLWKEGGGRR